MVRRVVSVATMTRLRKRQLRTGPKYPNDEKTSSAEPKVELSESDTKDLARLIGKYGRDTVAAIAKELPLRGPGRPSRGLFPYYERMHLADWIDSVAEEYRQSGSRKPIEAAELELYDLVFDDAEKRAHPFSSWRKNIKKKRLQGRRELRELREWVEWLEKRKKGRN